MLVFVSYASLRTRGKRESEALNRQGGAALVVCLLMMLAVLMLATSGAQIAIQEEKASRNERDRLIAQQTAEAALSDAELDIESSARIEQFTQQRGNPAAGRCETGLNNPFLGLCSPAAPDAFPTWQRIGRLQGGQAVSVPYGYFTGRSFVTGGGSAPANTPTYIIEVLNGSRKDAEGSDAPMERTYRVTALGYGSKEKTQVVLQTTYRKSTQGADALRAGRLSWREIMNWEELRDALEQE